ncbi:RNA polymerase-binding protein DksA [Coralloluteibacterium thermophilus]|uniref:RNA polymerase-binding transcription factor DksA n=1 Tax=Coralloluteibacterium thermophilum TaxID=2707049 RepID=A0ABV9NLB5_9GAMM
MSGGPEGRSPHSRGTPDVAVKKSATKTAKPAAAKTTPKKSAAPAKTSTKPAATTAKKPAPKKAAPARKAAGKTVAKPAPTPAKAPAKKAAAPAAAGKNAVSKTAASTTKDSGKKAAPAKTAPAKAEAKGARARAAAPASQREPVTLRPAAANNQRVTLPPGYRPSPDEEYMNPMQLEYFRQRLLKWRDDLVEESKQTIENLKEEVRDVGDEAERATRETENSLELRTRDRYRKLINKIDSTLRRVDDGSYGYCVDTGEEIGLERLEARLTAERTIDAQERWEHLQRQMGD